MLTTKRIAKEINEKTTNVESKLSDIETLLKKFDGGIVAKADKYDETQKLLKNVKINVKKFSTEFKDNATVALKVEYEIPPIELIFDEDGNLLINERFRAMNLLNLISFDDMDKIKKQLDTVALQNKKISGK